MKKLKAVMICPVLQSLYTISNVLSHVQLIVTFNDFPFIVQ